MGERYIGLMVRADSQRQLRLVEVDSDRLGLGTDNSHVAWHLGCSEIDVRGADSLIDLYFPEQRDASTLATNDAYTRIARAIGYDGAELHGNGLFLGRTAEYVTCSLTESQHHALTVMHADTID